MDISWVSIAAAIGPILLGALVTLAWRNSHAINVLGIRLTTAERDLAHLRELFERQLERQLTKDR